MDVVPNQPQAVRTGWISWLARMSMAALCFEAVSGLAITFLPFQPAVQWSVLVHTLVGVAILLPLAWYVGRHWLDYRRHAMSQTVLLGYLGALALLVCSASGVVVTWQGLIGIRTSDLWRKIHLISTFVTLAAVLPHVVASFYRAWRLGATTGWAGYLGHSLSWTIVGVAVVAGLTVAYQGEKYPKPVSGGLQLPLRHEPSVRPEPRHDRYERRF